jgi:(S)-2-hydroxyglutarate dehydrogenase
MQSAIIIGGGIVGLATAIKLRNRFPDAAIKLLEKEAKVGTHQSTHNSGVLHCGLYYKPGSLKAKLAVAGIREMTAFCREHQIAHEICGKLVVATNDAESKRLDELLLRGEANGLKGLRRLARSAMREIEPHVGGIEAAHVPEEGIVDYRAVCDTMLNVILESGTQVLLRSKVQSIKRVKDEWAVASTQDVSSAEWIINTAGLHCDRVSQLAGHERKVRIVPFRGEYYELREESRGLCNHLIYPVPDPAFPFLGVHFTRMIHGGIEAGPNAVLAMAREGYRWRDINVRDLFDTLTFGGLYRFLWRYPSMAVTEIIQSASRSQFTKALQKLIPEISSQDLKPGGAGVRAQAMTPQGELVQDFHVVRGEKAIHLLNAPSPAATASLAIGGHIVGQI